MAADEGGQGVAKFVPRGVSPDGIVFGILLVHLFGGGIAVEDGAKNRRGTGADGTIVEVNLIRRDEKLLADFAPVSVFVLAEQAGIWKIVGGIRELGKERCAAGGGCGNTGCGSGEEMAAIEQAVPPNFNGKTGHVTTALGIKQGLG